MCGAIAGKCEHAFACNSFLTFVSFVVKKVVANPHPEA